MLLTDNPIGDVSADQYGFVAHARVLCDAIRAADPLPLTVGVLGPWGSGKSSFLNLCGQILREHDVVSVSFNPWKYDQRDEVWHALIQSVLSELTERLEAQREHGDQRRRAAVAAAVGKAKRLAVTTAWLLARRLATPVTAGLVTGADLELMEQAWAERDCGQYRHVNQFEADFAEVVRAGTAGGRLVLLIDDLDRCQPATAVAVLSSLKLFLGQASCVFVLAIDDAAIGAAVAGQLGYDAGQARRYLEKLIHLPVRLPVVPFVSIYRQLRDTVSVLGGDPALWFIVETSFGSNPRRVRRFVNAFNLTVAVMRLHSTPSRERLIHTAQLLALRSESPEFFDDLTGNLDRWRQTESGANPLVQEWMSASKIYDLPPAPTLDQVRAITGVIAVTGAAVTGLGAEE